MSWYTPESDVTVNEKTLANEQAAQAAKAAADAKAAASYVYGADPKKDVAITASQGQDLYSKLAAQSGTTQPRAASLSVPTATQVANASNTNIDTGQSNQTRGQQQAYLSQLQQSAAGNGPSAAQAQYARGMADTTANQFGQAAQGRGTSRAALVRGAAYNAAGIQQRGAFDTAALRANEQIAAQSQLGSALSGVRGQDLSLATNQAALDQGTSLANASAQNSAFLQDPKLALQAATSQQSAETTMRGQDITDVNTQTSQLIQQQGQQGALATARMELANAKSETDRNYWAKILGAVLTGAATVGAAAISGPAAPVVAPVVAAAGLEATQQAMTSQPAQGQTLQPAQSAFAPSIDQTGYNPTLNQNYQPQWYDPEQSQSYLDQMSTYGQGRY